MAIIKSLQTINAREGLQKRKPSQATGGLQISNSHYKEHHGGFLKNLKTEIPYSLAGALLGPYPEKMIIQKSPMRPNVQPITTDSSNHNAHLQMNG